MSIEIRGLCAGILKFERGPYINVHAQNIAMAIDLQSSHAQIISWQRRAEVNNSCFLINWNCRLPFKEDSLREGEWVCHENYELCDSLVFNHGECVVHGKRGLVEAFS